MHTHIHTLKYIHIIIGIKCFHCVLFNDFNQEDEHPNIICRWRTHTTFDIFESVDCRAW